jgi:hypothetical protein
MNLPLHSHAHVVQRFNTCIVNNTYTLNNKQRKIAKIVQKLCLQKKNARKPKRSGRKKNTTVDLFYNQAEQIEVTIELH